MDAVWYLFPSRNAAAASRVCGMWEAAGYRTAVAVDEGMEEPRGADVVMGVRYVGYYAAIRELVLRVAELGAEIVVCGGDDIRPPQKPVEHLAADFRRKFGKLYGVMQPVGDIDPRRGRPFGGTASAAVSPWIGRGWWEQAYRGLGPHWTGYHHLYGDEELREVALRRGVYWERADVGQYHEHWTRGHQDNLPAERRKEIMDRWDEDKALFLDRKKKGFPGC